VVLSRVTSEHSDFLLLRRIFYCRFYHSIADCKKHLGRRASRGDQSDFSGVPDTMHRLPSSSTLWRFRVASVLMLLKFLSVPTSASFLCYGFISGENVWMLWAAVALAVGLGCIILNLMISGRLRCPLCMVPPLQNRGCSKHRNATTVLGSHKLTVALSILFKDSFRCPYCGEPTAMEVRQRGRH
jgi:hypothetical protein